MTRGSETVASHKWVSDTPTQEGFYWHHDGESLFVVRFSKDKQGRWWYCYGDHPWDRYWLSNADHFWRSEFPMIEPEPPLVSPV